jgi:hypothetical protein
MSADAWTRFCESLLAAGRCIESAENPDDPDVRAAGYRYLLGLVRIGIEQSALLADLDRPRFIRIEDSFAKWGAENADNTYLHTHLRADTLYRIKGSRGSCFDFLIEVKEGFMHRGAPRNFATLCAEALEIEADGSFEIVVGGEPRAGNWLPLDPDAGQILIRQYFEDWEREVPATFEIERLEAPDAPPPPALAEDVDRILDDAGRWVDETAQFWSQWVPRLRAAHDPGALAPARAYSGGADDIRYGNDYYQLGADDALVIECDVPRARYWHFQLCNLWFVTTDYAHRQTSLNDHQMHVDTDGRFRCVVAHNDPGVPNWLDTGGAPEGIIQYRWIWTEDNPQPSVRTVPLAEVRAALPADTPVVESEQRRATLLARSRHVSRRERLG